MANMYDIADDTLTIQDLLEPESRTKTQFLDYQPGRVDDESFARLVDFVAGRTTRVRWAGTGYVVQGELDDDDVTLQEFPEEAEQIIAVLHCDVPEHLRDDLRDLRIMNDVRSLAGKTVTAVLVVPRYPF